MASLPASHSPTVAAGDHAGDCDQRSTAPPIVIPNATSSVFQNGRDSLTS